LEKNEGSLPHKKQREWEMKLEITFFGAARIIQSRKGQNKEN
jgi:hypothetical protein